jgi:DUF4097 and DUF4098 domain-containing protein YvlB
MRLALVASLLVTLAMAAATSDVAAAQDGRRDAAQTDKTVDVTRGSRLVLEGFSGAVTVRAWEKDSVRVQARHSNVNRVSIRTIKSTVSIQSESTTGRLGSVEYEISVPRWMPVAIEVTYDDITIEGTESDVSAETVRGDITIRGGSGSVKADSVEGRVEIEGAKGHVEAGSVNDLIRIERTVGEIAAETTNGEITLRQIQSAMVEATTVNGSITYEGLIADDGHYRLSTHNGNILVAIPDRSNVTFDVQTYNGSFSSELPVKGSAAARRGGHGLYTLGSGSARMELESFGGSIKVRSALAMPTSGRRGRRQAP